MPVNPKIAPQKVVLLQLDFYLFVMGEPLKPAMPIYMKIATLLQ